MTKKILLIESDGPFAQQISTALAARGLEALVSADGSEGLEQARAERPDLIVLCVELPRMSGYAVCNRLKKDEQLRGIPLLITSAEATAETFEQHRKLKTHADDYLLKPFDAAALLQRMAALIELPPPPAGAPVESVPLEDLELDAIGAEVVEEPPRASSRGAPAIDDDDLKLLDQVFDELAASGAELAPPGAAGAATLGDARARPAPALPEAGAAAATAGAPSPRPEQGNVGELRARIAEVTAELARAREELQKEAAAHAQRLARDEQELREAREAARAAAERARGAEERASAAEARAAVAEQRLRRDDAVREKTRKALALALQLLEDPGLRAASGEVLPRRE